MGFRWWIVAVVLVATWFAAVDSWPVVESDTTTGLCAVSVLIHGYKCQEFHVTTSDGYILSVQRIPEGRSGVAAGGVRRQPVLLQHGFLVDGSSWVLNSPEESLPMILAEKGFDVWIVNTRGTAFSRRHVSLSPLLPRYWEWSWDELATHDLPAAINFIYKNTGNQKINYVGHSLGTLVALTALSERKHIDKLRSASLLSPVAYLSHMRSSFLNLAARSLLSEVPIITISNLLTINIYLLQLLSFFLFFKSYRLLGIAKFDLSAFQVKAFIRFICAKPGIQCFDLLATVTGKNCCLNTTTIDLYLASQPQPTATKNVVHLAQIVKSGMLSKYNHGAPLLNYLHYGQYTPPIYNLSNIPTNFPLFLSYGGNDFISGPEDVKTLLNILKNHNPNKITVQYVPNYGHVDFVLGLTAKDVVYNHVVAFLNNPF